MFLLCPVTPILDHTLYMNEHSSFPLKHESSVSVLESLARLGTILISFGLILTPIRTVKISHWLSSNSFGSWLAASLATYCPGRMAGHLKSKSIGGCYQQDGSSCTIDLPQYNFITLASSTIIHVHRHSSGSRRMQTELRTWSTYARVSSMYVLDYI